MEMPTTSTGFWGCSGGGASLGGGGGGGWSGGGGGLGTSARPTLIGGGLALTFSGSGGGGGRGRDGVLLDVERELGDPLALHHVDQPHHLAVVERLVGGDDRPRLRVLGLRLVAAAGELLFAHLRPVEEDLGVLVHHHVHQA